MNRLGLFKRAAALAATPALVALPPGWRALTPSEPSIPEPPLAPIGFTTGYASFHGQPYPYAMPLHSHGAHTHDASGATHTHYPAHTHCLCHGHCGCRFR